MKHLSALIFLFTLTVSFTHAQWVTETLPDGRSEISSVAIGDNIYFIGGSTSGTQRYFKMNILNVPSNSWTTVDVADGTKAPMTTVIGC